MKTKHAAQKTRQPHHAFNVRVEIKADTPAAARREMRRLAHVLEDEGVKVPWVLGTYAGKNANFIEWKEIPL